MRKNEKWVVLAKSADFNRIGKSYGVDPVIARIVRNREVIEKEDLDAYFHPSLNNLHDPGLLKGADKAAGILQQKIEQQKKIRIIGDYDIEVFFLPIFCIMDCSNAALRWIIRCRIVSMTVTG